MTNKIFLKYPEHADLQVYTPMTVREEGEEEEEEKEEKEGVEETN